MGYTERWRQYKSQKAGEFERARIEREKAKANKGPLGELAPLASALGAAFGLPYVGSLISGVGGVVGTVGTAMAGASDLEKLLNAYTAYTGTQQTGDIGAGLGQAAMQAPITMAQAELEKRIGDVLKSKGDLSKPVAKTSEQGREYATAMNKRRQEDLEAVRLQLKEGESIVFNKDRVPVIKKEEPSVEKEVSELVKKKGLVDKALKPSKLEDRLDDGNYKTLLTNYRSEDYTNKEADILASFDWAEMNKIALPKDFTLNVKAIIDTKKFNQAIEQILAEGDGFMKRNIKYAELTGNTDDLGILKLAYKKVKGKDWK